MGKLRTVDRALRRVENRIVEELKLDFRRRYEAAAGMYVNLKFRMPDLEWLRNRFRKYMLLACVFGKAYAISLIPAKFRRPIKEKRFAEDPFIQQLKVVITQNKDILVALLNVPALPSSASDLAEFFRPSEEALNFIRGYEPLLSNVFDQDIIRKVQGAIEETIARGMSEKEAMQYLRSKFEEFTENRVRAIARTEATRAFNVGTLEESAQSRIVRGYRFVAVLDDRTTDICRARHGKFIPIDRVDTLGNELPPLHVNCRSIVEPITEFDKTEYEEMPSYWEAGLQAKKRTYDYVESRKVVQRALSKRWGMKFEEGTA